MVFHSSVFYQICGVNEEEVYANLQRSLLRLFASAGNSAMHMHCVNAVEKDQLLR
jgi:hypothetical protein